MPLELLEDRGGAGLRFEILLPHGSHQQASQSLPLLLGQMGAQDPAGPGQQGVRVRGNRTYDELIHLMSSFIGARSIVVRHVGGSRLPGRPAGGLTRLSNRLTRQTGKLVRALQASAQGTGIVWNNRHGRPFSSLRVTAGLVFHAQLFAQAPLRTQAEDGTMI
jgi:hypothetical protein